MAFFQPNLPSTSPAPPLLPTPNTQTFNPNIPIVGRVNLQEFLLQSAQLLQQSLRIANENRVARERLAQEKAQAEEKNALQATINNLKAEENALEAARVANESARVRVAEAKEGREAETFSAKRAVQLEEAKLEVDTARADWFRSNADLARARATGQGVSATSLNNSLQLGRRVVDSAKTLILSELDSPANRGEALKAALGGTLSEINTQGLVNKYVHMSPSEVTQEINRLQQNEEMLFPEQRARLEDLRIIGQGYANYIGGRLDEIVPEKEFRDQTLGAIDRALVRPAEISEAQVKDDDIDAFIEGIADEDDPQALLEGIRTTITSKTQDPIQQRQLSDRIFQRLPADKRQSILNLRSE